MIEYSLNYDKIMISNEMRYYKMIQIRPVSDLRNKSSEIEKLVQEGEPVFLTKNGYGTMVVMSLDTYSKLIDNTVENALREADDFAEIDDRRMTSDEVFGKINRRLGEVGK